MPSISLKDKSSKKGGKNPQGVNGGKHPESPSNDVLKPYEYETEPGSPTKGKYKPTGGFRYDEPPHQHGHQLPSVLGTGQVPQSNKPTTGLAFNYAPGGNDALKDQAQKLKTGDVSPSKPKHGKDITAPKTPPPAVPLKTPTTPLTPISPGSDRADTTDPFITNERLAAQSPAIGGKGAPQKIKVKILLIISRYDTKTRRIDTVNADIEHLNGLLNPESGRIETSIGIIDPKRATVEVQNNDTGKISTYQGAIESKTGNIHMTSGVVDRKTGIVNASLGQIICIAPEDNAVIEVSGITGKLDAEGKIDIMNSTIERSRGLLNLRTSFVDTKYGSVNPQTGEVQTTDLKGKPIRRSGIVDTTTGQLTITGIPDPKSGRIDTSVGQLIAFGTPIDPIVEITVVSGKIDKKGLIDPRTSTIENSTGQLNTRTNKIDTKYGQLNLMKHTITVADTKSGKQENKDIRIDPLTGQILLKNCVNPRTGKQEKDFGQLMSLKIVNTRLDPNTGKVVSSADGKDVLIDPRTNQIWIADSRDVKTDEIIYSSSQVDPKTGTITIIYGYLNPQTNEVERHSKTNPNLYRIDDESGRVFSSIGDDDTTSTPLFAATRVEPNGDVVTKVAKVDDTGKIVVVRINVIERPRGSEKPTTLPGAVAATPKSKSGGLSSSLAGNKLILYIPVLGLFRVAFR